MEIECMDLIQQEIKSISGIFMDYNELIEESSGDLSKALVIYGYAYIEVCKMYGSKTKNIKGIRGIVSQFPELLGD